MILQPTLAISCLALLSLSACVTPIHNDESFEMGMPTDSVEVFGSGILSDNAITRDFTINSAGTDLFYTRVAPKNRISVIMHATKNADGQWSLPEMAPFSGRYADLEPAFSPDGKRLFFASKRPRSEADSRTDFDIWVVDWTGNGWSEPQNLAMNTTGDEFYPSVAANGNLYYTAQRDSAPGREDIFVSTQASGYSDETALGPGVNTDKYEFNAFVSPDEEYLLFTSFGREDDLGGGDLYISRRSANGAWGPAENLGPNYNSPALDFSPFAFPDGQILVFSSERTEIPAAFGSPITAESFEAMLDSPVNGNMSLYWVKW